MVAKYSVVFFLVVNRIRRLKFAICIMHIKVYYFVNLKVSYVNVVSNRYKFSKILTTS